MLFDLPSFDRLGNSERLDRYFLETISAAYLVCTVTSRWRFIASDMKIEKEAATMTIM
jgi:hypothetical protein